MFISLKNKCLSLINKVCPEKHSKFKNLYHAMNSVTEREDLLLGDAQTFI